MYLHHAILIAVMFVTDVFSHESFKYSLL